MNESEPYKELGILIKDKDKWEENIPYVSSLLAHDSVYRTRGRFLCFITRNHSLSHCPRIASFSDQQLAC